MPVVDVSEANDWTAVRVGLGESGKFGSVYPTYGFIYDRPDNGVMLAARSAPAPQPELNPAPNDLRPAQRAGSRRRTTRSPKRRSRRGGTGTRCIWLSTIRARWRRWSGNCDRPPSRAHRMTVPATRATTTAAGQRRSDMVGFRPT